MINTEELRAKLEAAWPELIAREEISHYTGGIYKAKTMEVYDSKGTGVKNPVRFKGRKIAYTKDELINWLIARLEAKNANTRQQ